MKEKDHEEIPTNNRFTILEKQIEVTQDQILKDPVGTQAEQILLLVQ